MEKLERLKKQKWVIAVSGGSDSMALLDMCTKAHIEFVVAHVNYKKRESADRDMQGVLEYCEKHHIPCYVNIVEKYKEKGNFQAEAREIRYMFFKECIEKTGYDGVLVAHHKDDVLETYLMQKRAKRIPSYYGIKEEVELYGMKVKRILLDFTKEQLKQYCHQNQVTYFDDESNFSDDYERNRIRHSLVEKMSEDEKDELFMEMMKKNQKLQEEQNKVNEFLSLYPESIDKEAFLMLEEELQKKVLRQLIGAYTKVDTLSIKAIEDIRHMIVSSKKAYVRHKVNDAYDFVVEYGKLYVEENGEEASFSYSLKEITYLNTPYFKITKEGKKIEGVTLYPEDFPITIRNAKLEDEIKLRLGTKKVRRFFIDNKIPHQMRKKWPVVENSKGNIIFVSGIGCDINHYSNNFSMFVLK